MISCFMMLIVSFCLFGLNVTPQIREGFALASEGVQGLYHLSALKLPLKVLLLMWYLRFSFPGARLKA